MENNLLRKSIICPYCNRRLEFTTDAGQLKEMKESKLFNFVIMHAEDHTLVVSIDGKGDIRRTRVATVNDLNKENNNSTYKVIEIINHSENLKDALINWIKK